MFEEFSCICESLQWVISFQTWYIELFYLKCIKHELSKGDENRRRETGRSSPNAGSLLIQRPWFQGVIYRSLFSFESPSPAPAGVSPSLLSSPSLLRRLWSSLSPSPGGHFLVLIFYVAIANHCRFSRSTRRCVLWWQSVGSQHLVLSHLIFIQYRMPPPRSLVFPLVSSSPVSWCAAISWCLIW